MSALPDLLDGFRVAATPANLGWAFVGVTLGTGVGVLPGIGPAMTVALLLPITLKLGPISAFIMFAGIYYGGMYGGSTTSILLKTPGESASMITSLEGNKMARSGRAAQALATAAIGSFVAGTLATGLLVFAAPTVANWAVQFGPAEFFLIVLLAFLTVSSVLGSSRIRGISALAIGLAIGLIGIDSQTGQARFTMGIPQLFDGADTVIVAVGVFAVGEALWVASRLSKSEQQLIPVGRAWMNKSDWSRSWRPWLRGTALGFPFGAMPAGGAEIPTFLSYALEKRLTKHPEEFGHGAIEGVAGPEAANNAAAAGVLVPLLTLGLPTSSTAAVMLAAFQQYGLQPGPLLFETNGDLVWGLIASLFIGNTMLLVLNLPLAPLWAKLLRIPRPYLYAGILLFGALGGYAANGSGIDLLILFAIGLIGLGMRRFGFPIAPLVIGAILGPMCEEQYRRALAIGQGKHSVFLEGSICKALVGLLLAVVLAPFLASLRKRRRQSQVPSAGLDSSDGVQPGTNGDTLAR
jgi:putative tricarboxylic transport membrane protein